MIIGMLLQLIDLRLSVPALPPVLGALCHVVPIVAGHGRLNAKESCHQRECVVGDYLRAADDPRSGRSHTRNSRNDRFPGGVRLHPADVIDQMLGRSTL
jgi:hypothetical protein